jgi:hypothetical protein
MAFDKGIAVPSELALGLMGRILAADDFALVHKQAGENRQLVRQFHAERRRSFYACWRVICRDALGSAAAQGAQRGVGWWLGRVSVFATLGWWVIGAELQLLRLRLGRDTPGIFVSKWRRWPFKAISILP